MASTILVALATIGAGYLFLKALVHLTQDPKEPPMVTGKIPFVSPAIGLATEKANYYVRLRDEHHYPIYTLRAPGPRLYIVNSLNLIKRLDRHIETVAFSPIEIRVADKVMGIGKTGLGKMSGDHLFSKNGFMMGFGKKVAPATMPGRGLDALQRAAVTTLAAIVEDVAAEGSRVVDLYEFTRRGIFYATTDAMYGPHNPLRTPGNEETWYAYERGIMPLLIGVLPNIFAWKSLVAREKLAIDMKSYLTDKQSSGSLFLKLRQEHNRSFGLTLEDSVRAEIGQVIAATGSTGVSAFWGIWQILADPEVFADCVRETAALVDADKDGNHTIDLSRVRSACPILVSTWQEILRFHGLSVQARAVQEDTMLDNQYLLKKGALVMMPTKVLHSDEETWGPTVRQFNHKRFLKTEKPRGDEKRVPLAGFRGFGGGHIICPGRHFATGEILSFIVLLLVRFDIQTVAGKWTEPKKDFAMHAAFPRPLDKVEVRLTAKDQGRWTVLFSDSDDAVKVVAEDE